MKTQSKPQKNTHRLVENGLPEVIQANELLHRRSLNKAQYQDLISIKAGRKKWEKEHTPLFFLIGLSVSLFLITLAFNWKRYDDMQIMDLGSVKSDFDEIIEMPASQQAPPPPPQKKLEVFDLKEVDNQQILEDIDLSLDVEMNENQEIGEVNFDAPMVGAVEEEKVEEIFQVVETWPSPEGGMGSFYKYVADHLIYPEQAKRLNISGIVFVRFVVEKDGSITDVQVIKGIGAGCDEEAAKVVGSAPAWNPGKQRGKPVRVYMTVPIRFVLQDR